MKKAFQPKAVISLLAHLNREINGYNHRCFHTYILLYTNTLYHFTKGIQSLLQEVFILNNIKKKSSSWADSGAYPLFAMGHLSDFAQQSNAFKGMHTKNNHTISYQNFKKAAYDIVYY